MKKAIENYIAEHNIDTTPINEKAETAVQAPKTSAIKPYERVDEETGEVLSKYRYLEGHPKQIRFNAKDGFFNVNGTDKLGDTLTFQPLAWRIFEDDILQMGRKKWAELFFVDEKNCVCAVLFHGWSVENLYKLIEPLFYEDLTLADVVITAKAEKKENTKTTPKGTYYIASFSYQIADAARTAELQVFTQDHKLYRTETLTELAEVRVSHGFYFPAIALSNGNQVAALPEEATA